MAVTIDAWYKAMPVVTKLYFTVALVTTLLITFGLLNPWYLFLSSELVFKHFQIWRLLTNFFFFGKFSLPFIIQMFILTSSFNNLEGSYFQGNAGLAEFTFLLSFGAVLLLIFGFLLEIFFLGPALVFMVLYIWSRKDPYRQVTLWGFAFAAWQYPFALLVLGILFGSNPILDILGIVIGHLYHFLVDVVPVKYGKQVIRCPQFIYDLYEHGNLHGRATGWQRGPGHRLDR